MTKSTKKPVDYYHDERKAFHPDNNMRSFWLVAFDPFAPLP